MAAPCPACATLGDYHHGFQKGGRDDEATYLPAAWGALHKLGDLPAIDCRTCWLLQCPRCGSYFTYRSDYEFLVSGTEDEQWLERLTPEQGQAMVATLHRQPPPSAG